jgi:hypothetical protein
LRIAARRSLTVTVVCSTSIRRRLDRLDLGQVADPVLLDRGVKPKTGSRMWSRSVRQIKEAHHCLDVLCLKLTEGRLGSRRRSDKLA